MSTALTLRQQLDSPQFAAQVARALPKHLPPDRFIRVACTTVMRTPKLAQCDQASFFNALLTLSQLGIEPDGRRAHLIPFENRKRGCVECQLIIDYKGIAELVMRSGLVSTLHADIVCDKDEFEFNLGEIVKHKVNFRESRGEPYAAYCVCTFKDGTRKADVMSYNEIEAIRGRSRAGQSGPWVTDWAEMAKKTVFRRLSKWLPLSPEIRDAVEADDEPKVIEVQATASPSAMFALPAPAPEQLPAPPEDDVPWGSEEAASAPAAAPQPAPVAAPQPAPVATPRPPAKRAPAASVAPASGTVTVSAGESDFRAGLMDFVSGHGVTFDQLVKWLKMTKRLPDGAEPADIMEVPNAICAALANEPKSIAELVKWAKGGVA